MGVDNEELKATRKLREKTADVMFDELGFSKLSEVGNDIRITVYRKYNDKHIQFNHLVKKVMLTGKYQFFDMEELKAINKKCEELGWL